MAALRPRRIAPILLLLATALIAGLVLILAATTVGGVAAPAAPAPPPGSADSPVADEHYAFKHVAIGGGGFITGLAIDRSGGSFLARADTYGAYRWDVTRDRWQQLVTAASMPPEDRHQNGIAQGVFEIAVADSDPKRLVMAVKGWIYRSVDDGRNWLRAAPAAPFPTAFDPNGPYRMYGPFLAIDPNNADHILFGTPAAGLWQSVDGGVQFAKVDGIPDSIAPDATRSRDAGGRAPGATIWFGGGRGLWVMAPGTGMFVSADNGAHFSALPNAAPTGPRFIAHGAFTADGSFFGADPVARTLWVYRDGRWTDLVATKALSPATYAAIAVDRHDGTMVVSDNGGQLWRSTDGGASWWRLMRKVAVGERDPPWLHVADQSYFSTADLRFDPQRAGRLWLGSGVGVFRADPPTAGLYLRWESQTRGIEQLVATEAAQAPGGAPAFAAWDFGIHVKSDLDAFSTTYGPRERVLIAAQQVAWSPADPRFLVTNASDTRTGCCSQDGQSVLAGYSLDGGANWQRFASLPTPPGTRPDDPWRMSFGMIAVSATDTRNIIWAPSSNRSPFYTKDRGATWQRVVLPGEKLPFTGSHAQYYLPRRTLAADRVLPGVFYYFHSGESDNPQLQGLWRTGDGGATWRRVFTGEIAPASAYSARLRTVPNKAGHLFFSSSVAEGNDTRLRRSVDGGRTWTIVADVDHVDDIAFGRAARGANYPAIYISGRVGGGYGIWRSVDNASHWQLLTEFPAGTLDQVSAIEADKTVFGRVYVGYQGSGWMYGEPSKCSMSGPVGEPACTAVR
jgi:photosystem II stability/assembly factor-like uncharacterized protein